MEENSSINFSQALFGFLNIYKPVGMTSHDVVAKLRRLLKIKQIGHTGTLDPFAEGVLPICVGKATRLIEYLADDKEYLATVQFGASTNTYDIEGEKTFISDKKITAADIDLTPFKGEIEQLPPIYSAIKVKGKKLYEYARNGEQVEIKPRKVTIENIELKSFDKKTQQAEILIKCSKGTYIRSIAHDLGQNSGTGAHLVKLVRTQAGKFRVENSISLEETNIKEKIINPIEILDLPQISLTENELEKIKHGMDLKRVEKFPEQNVILVYNNNEICAVGTTDFDKVKTKKVFI